MKFLSLIPAFLSLAAGTIAAPTATAADSVVVKRDAYSELKALDAEVKQRRAVIKSAVSSMTASSRVAQNATSQATIEREMQAMTVAIQRTTAAIQANPTNEGLFPIGVLLAGIIDVVLAGAGDSLLGIGALVDAAISLLAQLLNDGLVGGGIRAMLALLEALLSVGQPEVPVGQPEVPVGPTLMLVRY